MQVDMNPSSSQTRRAQELRVSWAFQKDKAEDTATHIHIFVGNLSGNVTDPALLEAFKAVGSCSDARVMWDHATGRSKGYGFVSFRCVAALRVGLRQCL